jgi:hypothetical protein
VDVYDKPSWGGNTTWLDELFTFEVPPTHLTTIGDWSQTFSVNNTALGTLQDCLLSTLGGVGGIPVIGAMDFTTNIAQAFYYNGLGNVTGTIANIAGSLTNAMRAGLPPAGLEVPPKLSKSTSTSNGCGSSFL